MTEPPSRRQQRAAATAEQLLSAARSVFEEMGYQGASVGAITRAADCGHGTFYLHFDNKEDAFTRVMTAAVEEMYREAGTPTGDDPRSRLAAVTRAFLLAYRDHRALWRSMLEGALQSENLERMWLDLRRPFIERIDGQLGQLVANGRIRPLDTVVAAHALGSMVEWLAFAHFVLKEPSPEDVDLERVVATVTDLWWHAVYGGSGPETGVERPAPN